MDNLDYKSNSDASKNRKPKPKIVSCDVKAKNETKMGKLASIFIAEDVSNVKDYMWNSVIVPNVKNGICEFIATVCDIVTNSFSMMINGTPMHGGKTRFGNKTNYSSYFVQPRNDPAPNNSRSVNEIPTTDFIFPTKEDAEIVLQYLQEQLYEYHTVSVSDLYDCLGKTAKDNWQISNVGWKDLSGAYIQHARGGGWVLNLPKVVRL